MFYSVHELLVRRPDALCSNAAGLCVDHSSLLRAVVLGLRSFVVRRYIDIVPRGINPLVFEILSDQRALTAADNMTYRLVRCVNRVRRLFGVEINCDYDRFWIS